MNKKIIIIFIIILVIIAGGVWWYLSRPSYSSREKCINTCKNKGYKEGDCITSERLGEVLKELKKGLNQHKIRIESIGSCFIKGDKYCGKKGLCDCYCYSVHQAEEKKDIKNQRKTTVKERDAWRVDSLGALSTALETYYHKYGTYPVLDDTSEDGEFLKVLVETGFMGSMPKDPQHPKHFYEYHGTKNSYILKCYIEKKGSYADMIDGIADNTYLISRHH